MTYGFTKGDIPAPYRVLDWQERQERIPSDYGKMPERAAVKNFDPNNLNELDTPEPGLARQEREREKLEDAENDLIK